MADALVPDEKDGATPVHSNKRARAGSHRLEALGSFTSPLNAAIGHGVPAGVAADDCEDSSI
eukprot:2521022-Pleurochrysis_carterae.AAC.1